MTDRAKGWAVGMVVIAAIAGWFWWQQENPTPMDGAYSCEGHTTQADGVRALIDGSAEVVEGKIRPGATGADVALGHQVMNWGDVKTSSRGEFLVEMHPSAEIADTVIEPFWITCKHN